MKRTLLAVLLISPVAAAQEYRPVCGFGQTETEDDCAAPSTEFTTDDSPMFIGLDLGKPGRRLLDSGFGVDEIEAALCGRVEIDEGGFSEGCVVPADEYVCVEKNGSGPNALTEWRCKTGEAWALLAIEYETPVAVNSIITDFDDWDDDWSHWSLTAITTEGVGFDPTEADSLDETEPPWTWLGLVALAALAVGGATVIVNSLKP